ncbi:glutamate formimidoyltransferase [Sulfidibacter corallicola]|uniref:glutamate formimidoyltransferase n=1 Tax=Sulfidibacter corallicola TaxID=2818388 RepID=A0A8A4TRN0_SULCO|nr:glutamate formimidoyltransferase [Sulfidibacter corallicola]QTD52173.1 glutamate formimidoyltransferase [Sulfidibacter corallicola]
MSMLLECVPNFSEGRDSAVLDEIAAAIASVDQVRFLGRDSGLAAHRTVMTFAGPPEPVVEAAFRAVEAAVRLIDMRDHRGTHPRIGAADVCPLIPLRGMTMAQAADHARRLAHRVGTTLGVPSYLYCLAAQTPERISLAAIRAGEYEGLAKRMERPDGVPDFGPKRFQARCGAAVFGARELMLAYNVNLEGYHLKAAKRIAARIRESGRRVKGEVVPGLFRGVKAIGWDIEDFSRSQVSTNIMDIPAAPLHSVFEAVRELAEPMASKVDGSELIGLMPRACLRRAGLHFAERAGRSLENLPLDEVYRLGISGLGLDRVKPFSPDTHLIEHALGLAEDLI